MAEFLRPFMLVTRGEYSPDVGLEELHRREQTLASALGIEGEVDLTSATGRTAAACDVAQGTDQARGSDAARGSDIA